MTQERNTEAIFWSRVDIRSPEECWLWKGRLARNGYGTMRWDDRAQLVHRLAWFFSHGTPVVRPPEDKKVKGFVLHACDTPACCNPSHLFLGSYGDNMADMWRKGRHPRVLNTHRRKFTEGQVYEMREAHAVELISRRELATKYGVSVGTIDNVIRGGSCYGTK